MVKTRTGARTGVAGDKGSGNKTLDKRESALKQQKKNEPFQEKWINKCYEKLAYPNRNCLKMMEKVNGVLPRYVIKPQSSEQKQQALFLLLGEAFTEHHFPNHRIKKELLEPPKMEIEQKKKYLQEMRGFLREAVNKAIEECGFTSDSATSGKKNDEQIAMYIQEIKDTFRDGFSAHVTIDAFNQEAKDLLKAAAEKDQKKGIKKATQDSDQSDDSEDDHNSSFDDKIGITNTEEGDAAAKVFLAFMAYDDQKKKLYRDKFRSRRLCLPMALRQYYWWDYFKRKEEKKLSLKKGENIKKVVLRNFETKLKDSMKSQNIKQSTKGKNSKYIDAHVIEILDGAPPLKDLDDDDFIIDISSALNMADIHSGIYTPTLCLLSIPLQATYAAVGKDEKKDIILMLATNLFLVNKYCQLSPVVIFQLAENVIDRVKEEDPEYLDHISKCLAIQTNRSRVLDFLPDAFLEDTRAATKIFNSLSKKKKAEEEDAIRERYSDVLSDPTLFIRKWVSQLFVGVLSINGMMWAWDQLFMNDWSKETITNIALSILALIKPWMLRANMYSGARKVFIEEPSKLYTSDLRTALQCLEEGSLFTQIPMTKNFIDGSLLRPKESKVKPDETMVSRAPRLIKTSVPVAPFGRGEAFNLEVDLRDEDPVDDDDPMPIPERKPDSESEEDDEVPNRPRDPDEPPTPPESPPPPPTEVTWRPKDPNPVIPLKPCSISDSFDIYVDYVRFLPDPIRVCKVLGRILNSGLPKKSVGDILAYPLQESYQRSPAFKFKLPVNSEKIKMNNKAIIIFKIYGYQSNSRKVVVIGSCLLGLYIFKNKKFSLKVGGHQIRIRHGGPNPSGGLQDLEETDMDHNSPIPGTTLCVRILPASKIYDPVPLYEEGFYESSEAEPTPTENRLFEHYTSMEDYTTLTVGDSLREIQKEKRQKSLENGSQLQKYMETLLNHKVSKVPVPDMDYSYFVNYDQTYGINVCIQGAFGLPVAVEDHYIHALGEYIPSQSTKSVLSKSEWNKFRILTTRLDLASPQRSPDWLDLKTNIKPPYDDNGILLIRVYGIRLIYLPTEDESGDGGNDDTFGNLQEALAGKEEEDNEGHLSGGVIKPKDENAFLIDYDEPLAWSVVRVFDGECGLGGLHRVAVFEGEPDKEVLSQIAKGGHILEVLHENVSRGILKLEENGLLEVEIWDGHLETEDIPEPILDKQLSKLDIEESALEARAQEFKPAFAEFVFENLSEAVRDKGTASNKFVKEGHIFQKEAYSQFLTSLNKALKYAKKEEIR